MDIGVLYKRTLNNLVYLRSKVKVRENKPKRAQSAYKLWLNVHREEIKTKHPDVSNTELKKKAREMWQNQNGSKCTRLKREISWR